MVAILQGKIPRKKLSGKKLVRITCDDGRDLDYHEYNNDRWGTVPSFHEILQRSKKWLPQFLHGPRAASKEQDEAIDQEDTQTPLPQPIDNESEVLLTLEQVFFIVEVDQAEPLAGDVFRRRFHTDSFPGEPRHFVALASLADGSLLSLGYLHYTMWKGCALGGGLVIDERHHHRLPPPVRRLLQDAGGVAELLFRESFLRLPGDTIAIWRHVGDRQSEKVCLRG